MKTVQINDAMVNTAPSMRMLHKRWLEWKEAGLPSCDEMLVDILPRLNTTPNVVTVFGCSGHAHRDNNAYIMFAADEIGINWVFDFHFKIMCKLKHFDQRCSVRLLFGLSLFPIWFKTTYPTLTLEAQFPGNYEQDQADFIQAMRDVLTELGM